MIAMATGRGRKEMRARDENKERTGHTKQSVCYSPAFWERTRSHEVEEKKSYIDNMRDRKFGAHNHSAP